MALIRPFKRIVFEAMTSETFNSNATTNGKKNNDKTSDVEFTQENKTQEFARITCMNEQFFPVHNICEPKTEREHIIA